MPIFPSHRITTIFGEVLPQTTQLRVTNKACVVKHRTILHIFRPVDQRYPLKILTEVRDKGSDPHNRTFRLRMYLQPALRDKPPDTEAPQLEVKHCSKQAGAFFLLLEAHQGS
jgi:hypothetical protein